MRRPVLVTPALQERHGSRGRLLALVGGAVLVVSGLLPWAYSFDALDGMTLLGNPSPLQVMGMVLGLLVLAGLLGPRFLPARRGRPRVGWLRAARAAAAGALVFTLLIVASIAAELGGLVNVNYGGWIALVGALLAFAGTRLVAPDPLPTLYTAQTRDWLELLAIVVVMAAALFGIAYALDTDDAGAFVSFIAFAGTVIAALFALGVMGWLSAVSQRHRKVLILASFLVAFLFPFTQDGSDANMSIATQVIIFAAAAMGLNIVVGLAGLLDLGYIAFLGAGAFVAAILSRSAFSTLDWHPPFIVVVLISGLVSATLGLIIGTPTLRVSGDYLAIVTLAFGEIFRITMINLDGEAGPNLTRGSNGIPAIPDLELFGFDFGDPHVLLGIPLGRFSNYYFLLLVVIALIILVFTRLNNSRIGRGWVAIREDEKAAEAMGVNVFGLKLFAFAGGAFLAGVAGSVKAHQDVSVTPDQYNFLQSAFLLAAIVLGGMGTVLGVLVGATLLILLPEKLRFVSEFRLLLFGLTLIVMMRFRPEGLIASRRRQLEFHEDDDELAERIDDQIQPSTLKGATT
ncbi:branched-chain amino acid transport system permease protein [Friedmanniella luteola]|uniref:Branched-chain amino acid transport system permease protein n=1 Tax=Friedmanniella luteola TaxID=546871 RepID=A0A1H1PED0_9ACTN|nr:branched-chain amino acid ABC transporter permease [Friedmanniella luteola]SDS09626.1 branched-chain amino acid transport system permease protein [Friedmanniella luteola]